MLRGKRFHWELETQLAAIVPACKVVAPGAPNRVLLEAERDRVQQAYNEFYAIDTDPEVTYSVVREEGVARKSARLQEQEQVVTLVQEEDEDDDEDDDSGSGDYSSDEDIMQVASEL